MAGGDHPTAVDAIAAHHRNRGLRQIAPLQGEVEVVAAERLVLFDSDRRNAPLLDVGHLLGRAQVVAGREVLAFSPDHDHAHSAVLVGAIQRMIELVEQLPALGVAVAWPVERDDRNRSVNVVADIGVRHV
jgi:hypothetical protein